MAQIEVDQYKIAHISVNELEYERIIDALNYYRYHENMRDKDLKKLIDEITLDQV